MIVFDILLGFALYSLTDMFFDHFTKKSLTERLLSPIFLRNRGDKK